MNNEADGTWVVVNIAELEPESVARFDHGGRTFAIYRSPDGAYFATDGICTHERAFLADGLVLEDEIECPLHGGAFNYRTGKAVGAPVCIDLRTYAVRVEAGKLLMRIDQSGPQLGLGIGFDP